MKTIGTKASQFHVLILFVVALFAHPAAATLVTQRFGDGATCTTAGQGNHADTWVQQAYPDSHTALTGEQCGGASYLYYRYLPSNNNPLFRFDVSSIPAGTRVTKATLRFFVKDNYGPQSPNGNIGISKPLYAITDPDGTGGWDETTATWNQKRAGVKWSAGGNVNTALGPQIGSVYFKNWIGGSYARQDFFDADITAAVQAWVNQPATNLGFMLQDDATFNRTLFSREYSDATRRPYIEITYDGSGVSVPPAPANVQALYHAGQTFITWNEATTGKDNTSYRIYRSSQPITSDNLEQAELIDQVYQGSSYTSDSVYGDPSGIRQPDLSRIGIHLQPNNGLYVYTVESPGTWYYAVTTVVDGSENRSISAGSNATAGGVAETIGIPEPYYFSQQPGYYVGYVMWLSRFNPADSTDHYGLDNRRSAPFFFSVTTPWSYSHTKQYPLTLFLHASNQAYFGSEEGVDNARNDTGYCMGFNDTTRYIVKNAAGQLLDLGPYLELTSYGYSKYRGWNSNYTPTSIVNGFFKTFSPTLPYGAGRNVEYGEKAMVFTAQWVMAHSHWFSNTLDYTTDIDPNRIYVTGGSAGGSGSLVLAVHYPAMFAAANDYKGRTTVRSEIFPSDQSAACGTALENIPMPSGIGFYDYTDMTQQVAANPGLEYPPMRTVNAKNDSTIPWYQIPPFLQAAKAARLWMTSYWDESDHTGDQTAMFADYINPRNFYNSQSQPGFNIFSFAKNRSYPAFSDCPLDENAGNGSSSDGDQYGGINRYEWWDNGSIVDTAGRYAVNLYLTTPCPVASTTVTVTLRNLQNLVRAPGATYRWQNVRASDGTPVQTGGTASADAYGHITITGIAISKTPSTLVLQTLNTYYRDADGDGFGDAGSSVVDVAPPAGYVTNGGDCDDHDAATYPGAPEVCDGKDNNCNGQIDEGVGTSSTAQVRPSSLQGWTQRTTAGSSSVTFINGPATPPLGAGSVRLALDAAPGQSAALGTMSYNALPLRAVNALSYSTFVTSSGGSRLAPTMLLNVDQDGDGSIDDTLYFEPSFQSVAYFPSFPQDNVANGAWQTWDALHGGWWSHNGAANATSGAGVKSLAAYEAAFPNAVIRNGPDGTPGIQIAAGIDGQAWSNFVGSVDDVTIAANCSQTSYFFLPDPDTTAPVIGPLSVSEPAISPPDHRMAPISVNYAVMDDTDPAPVCTLTAASNEPDAGAGANDLPGDIAVVDAHHILLRAEHGDGAQRVYTVTITCVDASGNSSNRQVSIPVIDGRPVGPWGDVDQDGLVTTLDAELVQTYLSAPGTLTDAQKERIRRYGDIGGTVNHTSIGNGVVDDNDIQRLGLMSGGMIDAGTTGPDTPSYGDVDGDGHVTLLDAVLAQRARNGLVTGPALDRSNARGLGDVSPTVPSVTFGDGVIGPDDAAAIVARATGTETNAPAYTDYWPLHIPTFDNPGAGADVSVLHDVSGLEGPDTGNDITFTTAAVEEMGGYTVIRVAGSDGSTAGVFKGMDGSIYAMYLEWPPAFGERRLTFQSPIKILDANAAKAGTGAWSGQTMTDGQDLGLRPTPYDVTVLGVSDEYTPAAGAFPTGTPASTWSATVHVRLDIALLATPASNFEMQQALFLDFAPGIGIVSRGQATQQGAPAPTPDHPSLTLTSAHVRGIDYGPATP